MDTLKQFSDQLAQVVERAGSGVLRVEGRRRLPSTGIAWSADGIVVAAHHAVELDEGIQVGLPDGSTARAEVVGRDPGTDLAALRLESGGLAPIAWAPDGSVRPGHVVLALGRPGGPVMATLGVVSALGEGWRGPFGGRLESVVQSDVTMYPGFSGGPLVEVAAGTAVGMNTSGLLRGISVAVPHAAMSRVIGELLAHGRVRRGYLGVGAQPVRLPDKVQSEVAQETGLLLASVEPGSPADQSGLVIGDVLLQLDQVALRHIEDLLGSLTGERVGQAAQLRILRAGQLQTIRVRIGERG
jgi:S1-C subfamily serine protease